MVGVSEELMFRGIVVLHGALKDTSVIKSVIISAIVFSLLHSINVLGGNSLQEMIMQLGFTFVMGMFLGLIILKVNSLIPLIIFHWLWDFSLISSNIINSQNAIINILTGFHFYFEIIAMLVLLVLVYRKSRA